MQFRWTLLGVDASVLEAAQLDTSPDAEVLSDELDVSDVGRFEHRLRFWPDFEFGVAFDDVGLTLHPASPADRRAG